MLNFVDSAAFGKFANQKRKQANLPGVYHSQMQTGKNKPAQTIAKTLLFIGTSLEAVVAMGRAIGLGYKVLAVDGNPRSPGLAWVKKWGLGGAVVDIYNFQQIFKTVRYNGWRPDGVLAVGVDVGPNVSRVAAELGLFHIPPHITTLSWDKSSLKELLKEAGIPVPGYADFVVKPMDGRGSRGVSFVSASRLWGAEWERARAESPSGRLMCEQWVEGEGVSLEAIIWNSKVVFWGAADRIYQDSKTVEIGGQAPSRYHSEIKRLGLVQQIIQAIGLKAGTIKLDIIMQGQTPVIIEAAIGRLSGGLTCSHYLPLAYNVDFLAMAFAVYCGGDPTPFLSQGYLRSKIGSYFLSGRYEMPANVLRNGERGKFRLRLKRCPTF